MSAAEQMRMMLDQLMGADRNGKFQSLFIKFSVLCIYI